MAEHIPHTGYLPPGTTHSMLLNRFENGGGHDIVLHAFIETATRHGGYDITALRCTRCGFMFVIIQQGPKWELVTENPDDRTEFFAGRLACV